MNDFLNSALLNWKSTASGFLTLSLIASTALLTTPDLITAKHAAWLMAFQGIAKGWIALIQKDS